MHYQMLRPSLLTFSPGGRPGRSPTARNFLTHPLARRDVPLTRARAFQSSSPLVEGMAEAALHCAHRTSTASSCAFCEQEDAPLPISSSSISLFKGRPAQAPIARAQKIIRLHPSLLQKQRNQHGGRSISLRSLLAGEEPAAIIKKALRRAPRPDFRDETLANRNPTAGLHHHSDRGRQYAATSYQQLLTASGMIPNRSRKSNFWNNVCVESFFEALKRELMHHRHFATREETIREIIEYIEVFYNRQRRRSTLGYDSLTEHEARIVMA